MAAPVSSTAASPRPMRRPGLADTVVGRLDAVLRAATGVGLDQRRPTPPPAAPPGPLDEAARRHAAGLMRVNHTGEVCAQALYVGQGLGAREPARAAWLAEAAREEGDHLYWCRERLDALGARPSRLDPLWFAGALAIGTAAGCAGDRFSLGFVEETERQVVAHLDGHLARLPAADTASQAVVREMRRDEARHAAAAAARGGQRPPAPVRLLMAAQARVMTTLAYWI